MEPDPREANPVHGVLVLLSIALVCSAVFGFLNSHLDVAVLSLIGAFASGLIGLRPTRKERRAKEGGQLAVAWLVFGLLAAIVWPITAQPRGGYGYGPSCISNLKQLAIGMLMYAADNDDRFPLATTWHDELQLYTKREDLFHCPLATSPWSYALNRSMSGANEKTLNDPDQHVLLFEATAALPDASGGREWLAPHHPSRDTSKANIAFADSHVRAFTFEDSSQFKW